MLRQEAKRNYARKYNSNYMKIKWSNPQGEKSRSMTAYGWVLGSRK
jgi:hypothetical protein